MKMKFKFGKNTDNSTKKPRKPIPKKVKKIIIVSTSIALAVAIGFFIYLNQKSKSASNVSTINTEVTRGTLQVKIEGTGSVEPIERYDIMPLVKGTILEAPLEEGDSVSEGDLLCKIDYSDVTTEIEKATNSLEKLYLTQSDLNESLANLKLYANASGKLSEMSLKIGDTVSTSGGKIAEITDVLTLVATVPFNKVQLNDIQIGQTATIGIEQYMQTVQGTVVSKSSIPNASGNGSVMYNVEIHINAKAQNAEGIKEGTKVTATIEAGGKSITSPSEGEISFPETILLTSKSGGTVSNLYATNGEWVKKGQLIAVFENDSLTDQIKNNSLDIKDALSTLNSKKESLEDYIITSPIDGVVITKNYKKDDNLQLSSNSSTIIMTVADMSKMIFYIDADELDIAKIKIGQSVSVSADALEGQNFDAEVTQIATEGTSENGVSTYKVKVTINNPEGLLPGMNVTGEIVIEEKIDTLMVPVSAVTTRSGRYFVYLSTDKSSDKTSKTTPTAMKTLTVSAASTDSETSSQDEATPTPSSAQTETKHGKKARPSSDATGETPPTSENSSNSEATPTPSSAQTETTEPSASPALGDISERILRQLEANKPENTKIVEVTVGINNDEYIEILSGLSEGDIVVTTSVSTEKTATTTTNMPGGMTQGGMGDGSGAPRDMPGNKN